MAAKVPPVTVSAQIRPNSLIGRSAMNSELLEADTSAASGKISESHPDVSLYSDSPLLAIAPGPTRVVLSSASLPWKGFLLEKHLSSPGARSSTSTDRHIITLLCSSARIDYRTERGGALADLNRPGTLTVMPAGPVPGVRLHTSAEVIYCALDESFTRGVADEMDRALGPIPVFRSGLRDKSMGRILRLLLEELEAKGTLGRLYVDSLAHALATRYLLLEGALDVWSESRASALPPRILKRVREKIEANLHADLSLDSLAQESGYSRAHFLRMFSTATGST